MATSYAVCFGQSLTHKACREARKEAATPRYLCLRGLWPPARSARGRKHEALPPGFGSVAPHYNNSCRERKKGFFLFPFFSHLFRLPLHSAFEELDWECWVRVINTIYPKCSQPKKPPQKTPSQNMFGGTNKTKQKKSFDTKKYIFCSYPVCDWSRYQIFLFGMILSPRCCLVKSEGVRKLIAGL